MLTWLAHWNNWPFLLSLLVGLGLVVMTLIGFSGDLDHGADVDGDGPDLAKPDWLSFAAPFAVLGVGKVPVSVILEVFLVSFGLIGLIVNAMARDLLAEWGVVAFPVALVLAFAGSLFATRTLAGAIARFTPADAPTSRRTGEFAGSTGTAATLITRTIGQVRVESQGKAAPDALVNACIDPEFDTPMEITRNTEVYLVNYDASSGLYRVRPLSMT